MSKKTKPKRNAGAVAKVWGIFAKHPKDRAAALAAAEAAGINRYTARTQWQRFSHSTPKERAARFAWRPGDLRPLTDKKAKPEVRHG